MALTQQQIADMTAWVDQYAAQTERLSAQSAAAVTAAYSGVNFYSATAVAAAAEQAADTSNTASILAAGLAAEYLSFITAQATGTVVGIPNFPHIPVRNGVPLPAVFQRPIKLFRRQVARGVDPAQALESAMRLAALLADSDIRLAQRDASNQVLTYLAPRIGITGYRRVIRPELSKTGTCGLCIVASDRIYKTGELMPLHDRCKCAVLPIIGEVDPGNSLNNLWLDDIYAQAGSTLSADLKRVRYSVQEHGEKGPVLVLAGQKFTGVEDLGGYDLLTA